MNRRSLSLALTGLVACGLASLGHAGAVAPSIISTATSQNYPQVTCTSSDALACADTLQLAEDAHEQLAPILLLDRHWRFPVHIHIMMPDDPLLAKINREAAAVFADGDTLRIEAVLPSTDPDARAFLERQFVTALLWEKFFARTKNFDTHTKLDSVPVWLIEGLREWLDEDPEHDREEVVKRSVAIQHAPTLAEVTGWQHLSTDRLMGLWQRAFSFYLVDSLIRPGAKRTDFQQWLATLGGPNPGSAQLLFPTEAGWQHELVAATQRSHDIVYNWDETVAALATAEVVTIPATKTAGPRTCTIETAAATPLDPRLLAALRLKITELANLELRSHVSWRPIMELYRFGLVALISDPTPAKADKLMQQAHAMRTNEMANHQKLVDYVNWFEVTKDYGNQVSPFQNYFFTAAQMEKVEADPAHPNPIRDNLIQVESQCRFVSELQN